MSSFDIQDESDNDISVDLRGELIIWMIVSVVLAIIFARNSGGLCEYMFLTLVYIYIIFLITTVWKRFEFSSTDYAMITAAAITGWLIGTFIVWKSHKRNKFFSEICN